MAGLTFNAFTLGGLALVAASGAAALAHPPLPPGRAGECFTEVARPPAYRTVSETVPSAPIVSYRNIRAVLGHRNRRLVSVPARIERQIIPATYKTVPRWSLVPGPTRWVREEPTYRLVTERRLISPEHLEWRAGAAAHGFSPSQAQGGYGVSVRPTGEVQCRVLIPARYALVTRRVMIAPGGVHRVNGPSRKAICYVRVIATPARTIEHRIPAQYAHRSDDLCRATGPSGADRDARPGPHGVASGDRRACADGLGPDSLRRSWSFRRARDLAPCASASSGAPLSA